ncbi:MAG: Gfo/Idh/MocA family oxidoreductase [Armatimonadetes bacterium]|nr:Gfo/Idh/MocA family oxidoreductase [Armatimonadota bacterium]
MAKVRVGLLGVSWWTNVVWPGFSAARNAEFTWVASRTGANAEAFAREHGIPNWTDDTAAVLAAADVDAVFIGIPNHLHDATARAALAAGKHVLQEKPMALASAAAAEQARLASEKGLVLMVDQETRLADGVRDLPGIVERLGGLRKVVIGMTLSPGAWGGWRGDPELTGGSLFEMAIHQIDLARWLWGRDPVAVTGVGADVAGQDFTLIYEFGQGDTAIIDFCWRCRGFFRARVECYADGGVVTQDIQMPDGAGVQRIITADAIQEAPLDFGVQKPATFQRVMEGFADAVLTGAPQPIPAQDGVWAVRMAEAGREALRSGRRMEFDAL